MKFVDSKAKKYYGRVQWGLPQAPVVTISLRFSDSRDQGSFELTFDANGEGITQLFYDRSSPSAVGAAKWQFRCPETFKMLRTLHLLWGERHFRSRHALGLTYRSIAKAPLIATATVVKKLMERIGPTYFDMSPPRPKYMHRRTYARIWLKIHNEAMPMYHAHLGKSLPWFSRPTWE